MVPPQDNPTFQAVSSATPNSSIFGSPLSITSSASVTTAPSTQPPETEPRKFPSWSITRFEPTGRGAEPQVSTTVSSATSRPLLRQSSAALRMSSLVESMVRSPGRTLGAARSRYIHSCCCSPAAASRHSRHSLYFTIYNASSHLPHPGFRIACLVAPALECRHQRCHRVEIVNGAEFVDMREHGADAAGARLETLEAQQRVEPDQPPAGAVQPVDLEGERIVGIALKPVSNEQHDGALGQHPPRPQLVEAAQRGCNAGAAGPVGHAGRTGGQRIVGITLAQRTGDVAQPRAEQECADAFSHIGERMQKMQ